MRRAVALGSLVCLLFSALASAKSKQVGIQTGLDEGGLILGGDFLIDDTATESWGGYARLYSKDREEGAPSIIALGMSVRGQARLGLIEYYLMPGFGLMQHNFENSELLLGPSLGLGMSAEINPGVSLGIENSKLYSWIGEYKGLIKDSFLAQIRFRF